MVDNVYSFGQETEFLTIPNNRIDNHSHHKQSFENLNVLKVMSIYGANGAGKSNLIKVLHHLKNFIINHNKESNTFSFFKFNQGENKPQLIAIEFLEKNIPFYYGLKIHNSRIIQEELYISGLGKKADELLFERKEENGKIKLSFHSDIETRENIQMFKDLVIKEFIKPHQSIFQFLANREDEVFGKIKHAFKWFSQTLIVLMPGARMNGLSFYLSTNKEIYRFANEVISSLNIGITKIEVQDVSIEEFFGLNDLEKIKQVRRRFEDKTVENMSFFNKRGEEFVIYRKNDELRVNALKTTHKNINEEKSFFLSEESDGTLRLLHLIPIFHDLLNTDKVYVVDEIERSIHPLLIKELITKFSHNKNSKGQLIFTTHECNLLDQDIFRKDEVWFAEKNLAGSTTLYSLNDFKEHKTIDIRKGYLTGRYGSIPFLGSLNELKWE